MAGQLSRALLLSAIIATVGWWLFADTYRHHFSSAPADTNLIRFAHFGTFQDQQCWKEVINAFEREHADLRVQQEYIVGMYGAYNTKLRQQVVSDTLPNVFLMQLGPFSAMATRLADLTDLVNQPVGGIDPSEFAPTSIDCFKHDGRFRGLPVSGGNLLIYCNPDCFERASAFLGREIPLPKESWTMQEFRKIASDLTCDFDGDGELDQFGFWLPRFIYYLPFVWSFGADLLDATLGHWMFTGPEAEQALAFYQQLVIGDRVCPQGDEVAQMFQDVGFLTGTAAMCINGPWFQPFLAKTKLANRYVVAPIPRGPGGQVTRITWDGICMANNLDAPERANAWKFIRFVCSQKGQTILAANQRALPARTSAAESFVRADGGRVSRRFVEALAYSRTQPITPHFRAMDRAVNRHLRGLLRQDAPLTPGAFVEAIAMDRSIEDHFVVNKERH